jgi:hypothetical protein
VGNGWYKYFLTTTNFSAIDSFVRCEVYYNSPILAASPWSNNIIPWAFQLQKDSYSQNYYKTTTIPKANIIDEGFVNLTLIEPSLGLPNVKNLLTYSQSYTANNWKNNNLILSAYTANFLSPISTFDVFKLTPTTKNDFHFLTQTVNIPTTGVPYTFSVYAREDKNENLAYRYVALMTAASSASANNYFRAQFNLDDGSLVAYDGKNVALSSYTTTSAFSGWYRFSITADLNNYKDVLCQIYVGQHSLLNLEYAGDNNKHIYTWGSQFELGDNVSNYISTEEKSKSGISYTNIWSSTDPLSSYYFLGVAAPETLEYKNSKRFTGNDTFFLNKNKISYNELNPKYDFDVNGDFHSLSAYFETLSANFFIGSSLNITDFEFVNFNADVSGNKSWIMNYLSADKVFVTSLCSTSTVIIDLSVPSICANEVFSSLNWNVTAGGYLSAYSVNVRNKLITPYITARNSLFQNITAETFNVNTRLSSLSSIYGNDIHGFIQIDPTYFYYNDENLLTTRLSAVYFLGVKPSDSFSSDNTNLVRTISGAWDGQNGFTIETFPVLKPYFKNIKQALKYVEKQCLCGDELNIMIYDDILQNNINDDGTISSQGCEYSGNIDVRYYSTANVPQFLKDAGLKAGDYVWNKHNYSETTGKISYWSIDRLNFSNLNIYGMYEIGSLINFDSRKLYTNIKPFNIAPRKISFRTYVCTNTSLPLGSFGSNSNDFKNLYYDPVGKIELRPIKFNNDEMDVNIHNLCFEFETNANDSTCLYFKSGRSYLSNVTVAALNNGNYAYGAILAWPNSTVYICGEPQIDPWLLSPSRWDSWISLPTAKNQVYYPGYGLALVGNKSNKFNPTFFSDSFIQAWRSRIFFMDFNVNRRIGRYAYHNASIILDGKFTSNSFYSFKDHAKIYATNHVFKTQFFGLSNLECTYYTDNNYPFINVFENLNKDNFYYLNFKESNSTFIPNYFQINEWMFDDADEILSLPINDKTNFTEKLVNQQNTKYIFDEDTKTINLSGMVFANFQKNSIQTALPLNDNLYLYDYINPSNLTNYNINGLYKIKSPINQNEIFDLNFYSS